MEYELKLDDLLKSLTELGIDTDKLTIVEKAPEYDGHKPKDVTRLLSLEDLK